MVHERQDWNEEGLSPRAMTIAAAGLWGAGLLVGALGIWRANMPPKAAPQSVESATMTQESATRQATCPLDAVSGVATDEVTGAIVFPGDVLVARPSAASHHGVAEMQKR